MKWRESKLDSRNSVSCVGSYVFQVVRTGSAWRAFYYTGTVLVVIGEYATEKQAKTYAYRRAKALVERMVREVRDS